MDQFGGLIWSLARRFTDSAADAEDATQEIFLEIWRSAARYEASMGSEAAFITTIARRRLIDKLRSSNRRPKLEEFDETQHEPSDTGGEQHVLFATEAAAARRALEALDADQREVLLLGIVEGMTHSEIATETGRPLGTVKSQMRRGLARVRDILSDDGKGDDD